MLTLEYFAVSVWGIFKHPGTKAAEQAPEGRCGSSLHIYIMDNPECAPTQVGLVHVPDNEVITCTHKQAVGGFTCMHACMHIIILEYAKALW